MDNGRDFFRNGVCHTCKRTFGSLSKRCSQCQTVSYCSREHQIQDWRAHKRLCKVIAEERQKLDYKVNNYVELQRYKQQQGLWWQLKLGRKLTKAEFQMFMFPRVCGVCFRRDNLFDCSECCSEFYCSKEHQEHHYVMHKKSCKDLKLSLEMECFIYHNGLVNNVLKVKPIIKEEMLCMPENLVFDNILERSESSEDFKYLLSCDQILSGLTVLFALKQSNILSIRQLPKPSLKIHLVGTTFFEQDLYWALIIELIFHWIKNLKQIHIVCIGPEAEHFKIPLPSLKMQFCFECRHREDLIIKEPEVWQCLYNEAVEKLEKPDMVVALNSGLHEFAQSESDSWKNSLKSLVSSEEVPLVLTAYAYRELIQDVELMKKAARINVIYGPKKNPFSNMRPLHDWDSRDDQIYYANNFLAVLKRCIP